jgi:hypothetical protein
MLGSQVGFSTFLRFHAVSDGTAEIHCFVSQRTSELDHAAASGRLATADLEAFAASSIAAITKLVAV